MVSLFEIFLPESSLSWLWYSMLGQSSCFGWVKNKDELSWFVPRASCQYQSLKKPKPNRPDKILKSSVSQCYPFFGLTKVFIDTFVTRTTGVKRTIWTLQRHSSILDRSKLNTVIPFKDGAINGPSVTQWQRKSIKPKVPDRGGPEWLGTMYEARHKQSLARPSTWRSSH